MALQASNLSGISRDGEKVCVLPFGDFLDTYLRVTLDRSGEITNIEHYATHADAHHGQFNGLLGDDLNSNLTPHQITLLWVRIDSLERAKSGKLPRQTAEENLDIESAGYAL